MASPQSYLMNLNACDGVVALEHAWNLFVALDDQDLLGNSSGRFNFGDFLEKPHRWPEFWVPSLNNELFQDFENPRTVHEWYCGNHFSVALPISVLELTCDPSCEVQNLRDSTLAFPYLEE